MAQRDPSPLSSAPVILHYGVTVLSAAGAFFHNPDEEYRVLLPFLKDGFDPRIETPEEVRDPSFEPGKKWRWCQEDG